MLYVNGVLVTKVSIISGRKYAGFYKSKRTWDMHMHAVTPVTLEMVQGMNPECETRLVIEKVYGTGVDVRIELVLPQEVVAFASDTMRLNEHDTIHIGKAVIEMKIGV